MSDGRLSLAVWIQCTSVTDKKYFENKYLENTIFIFSKYFLSIFILYFQNTF